MTSRSENPLLCWARTTSTFSRGSWDWARRKFAGLEASDAVGQRLTPAQTPSAVPLDRQVELGWTVNYDSHYRQRLTSSDAD